MTRLAKQINASLDVYRYRGEWDGTVRGAYNCLRRSRYIWTPEIRAIVERRIRTAKEHHDGR